jgi:ABC-type hemin transport system substrate-binding protein
MNDERQRFLFIVHRSSFIVLLFLACAQPQTTTHEIHRVVTLAPNITEMVFAVGCGAKVVGTDNFSDYPEAVKRLPKVGGVEPDVEKITALHPDLVIASASGVHPSLRRALNAVHIPLRIIRTDRLSDVPPAISIVSSGLRCDSTVVTITAVLEKQRKRRAKSPRILFAVWTNPLYVAGRSTFIDDLFVLTGARNAVESRGWPQYSLELFATHPPDLLLYPNRSVTPAAIDDLMRRAKTKVESIAVDENVFTRPGPRVVIAAADLNRILDQWERSH